MGGARVAAVLVVDAVAVEAAVDACEYLVRLVDQAQVERRRVAQPAKACLAAGVLAPGEEDTVGRDVHRRISGLLGGDAEQVVKLVLPLTQKRSRHDDQHPCGAFGEQLRDDQAGFDGLAQAHLVGQDAAALRDATQSEHHRIDLMGIRVHVPATLRCNLSPPLAGAAQTHESLGVVASMDGMHWHGSSRVYRHMEW